MTRTFLMTAVAALALTGCSESDPSLNQVGATPDLPAVNETLIPVSYTHLTLPTKA